VYQLVNKKTLIISRCAVCMWKNKWANFFCHSLSAIWRIDGKTYGYVIFCDVWGKM